MSDAGEGAVMGPIDRASEDRRVYSDRRAPGAHELIEAALGVCRDELNHELESNVAQLADNSIQSWRKPVEAFAVLASRHDVPPQRVLAAFKKMVSELRPVQRLAINEREDLVRRLVEAAIEAYYQA